jgi:hypothetical protein
MPIVEPRVQPYRAASITGFAREDKVSIMSRMTHYDIDTIMERHRISFDRFMKYSGRRFLWKALWHSFMPTPRPNWIFVACMMKSGSSYITRKLRNATGYRQKSPVSYYVDMDHNIDIRMMDSMIRRRLVCQLHTPGNLYNIELMNRYGIRPVLLIRDPRDVIVSHHDHFFLETPISPMVRIEPGWYAWDKEKRIEYLMYHLLPYVVAWYRTWWQNKGRIEHLVVRYEELLGSEESKFQLFERILVFHGLERFVPRMKECLEVDTELEMRRANIMKLNRWKDEISESNMAIFNAIVGDTLSLLGYDDGNA